MADPEIPEDAVTAIVDKLESLGAELDVELDPLERAHLAREVLAAALPHLEEARVVLIKPGDKLIIGGIKVRDPDWLRQFGAALSKIGFPETVIVDADASIAVQPGGGE